MRAGINNDTQLINVEMLQHWVVISQINLLQNPNLVLVVEKVGQHFAIFEHIPNV